MAGIKTILGVGAVLGAAAVGVYCYQRYKSTENFNFDKEKFLNDSIDKSYYAPPIQITNPTINPTAPIHPFTYQLIGMSVANQNTIAVSQNPLDFLNCILNFSNAPIAYLFKDLWEEVLFDAALTDVKNEDELRKYLDKLRIIFSYRPYQLPAKTISLRSLKENKIDLKLYDRLLNKA